MASPLRGCDPSVRVSGVFDGTQVTIRDAAGVETTAGFDLSALRFVLPTPLAEGDELVIRQQFQLECKQTRGVWSAPPMPVGPASPVDPPTVQSPLCAGATRVTIMNLRPGATVHISANGTVYDGAVPPDSTAHTFSVPELTSSSVSATQEICGVLSGPSAVVTVDPREEHVPPALVLGPLFDCARTVSVASVHPGATIQIWARNAGGESPISDLVTLQATQGVVDVCPYLMVGEDVFAVQWACSDTGVKSPRAERVKPRPPLPPPMVLDPIFAGDTQVEVDNAIPGALVELYAAFGDAGAVYVGHAVANNLSPITPVLLNVPARARETIFARQALCNAQSDNGRPVGVTSAPQYGPRPFYVMAHNPNTISDVRDALANGANCVEPDVNVYDDTTDQLCISEAGITGNSTAGSSAPLLVGFLNDLRQAAMDFPQLALVVFDTKSPAVSAVNGLTLLSAIREHLTADTDLNVIISVASLSETAMFDSIKNRLRPREGLMVDSENDPIAVSNLFLSAGVANECYANGITHESILGPNVRPSMERVCEFRAALGRTKFIYVWTVNDDDHMREYIRIGVDSVDTDDVSTLSAIIGEPEFGSVIRLATRQDDPFRPGDFSYGLVIHTSDKWMAGTDANVTFTLTGTNGTAGKTVNTQLPYRMERNDWNYVTVPSDDLGTLQSITVQRDNQGNGPDWHLDTITVESDRYGTKLHAHFDCWIDSTAPFTRALTP
jgi:glycerophosphoryl diester phosphodiesterase